MVTKTSPKKAITLYTYPIKIEEKERLVILDLLGFCLKIEKSRCKIIVLRLERKLSRYFTLLRNLPEKPMPSHIRAELRGIALNANLLAEYLQPRIITQEAQDLLHQNTRQLWFTLHELMHNAKIGIKELDAQGKSDGGAQRARERILINDIKRTCVISESLF